MASLLLLQMPRPLNLATGGKPMIQMGNSDDVQRARAAAARIHRPGGTR